METDQDGYHNKNRAKVCIICYEKGKRGLSSSELQWIEENIITGYSVHNPDFPCGLCDRCHLLLANKISGKSAKLPVPESYDPERPRNLRSVDLCTCLLCKKATENGLTSLVAARKRKKKSGRPKKIDNTPKEALKVCSACFTKIYQGCRHQCSSSRRVRVTSIEDLIKSPGTAEALASRCINTNDRGSLKTLSNRDLPIRKNAVKKQLFSANNLSAMQVDLNLSTRQTFELAKEIRAASGSRKIIEKDLKEKIKERNHVLDSYFEHKMLDYKVIDKETKVEHMISQHTVLCSDVNSLINKVVSLRKLSDHALIRIGLDGGGGFVKVILSVFDLDEHADPARLSGSTKFKDSGVKKAFIIGIVPNITENYFNMKKIWINLGLLRFNRDFTIATDLKLCNILLGLMSHSSTHPCCWCDIQKGKLKNKGVLRTLESLGELFWKFYESQATKKEAKNFGNVIHLPMFDVEDKTKLVLELVPPPELHLLLGPVNTMFNGLESVCPESEAWLKACHIKRSEYHGGAFEGNECRKLLKKVSLLRSITNNTAYCNAFEAFNDVVASCYGSKLDQDYAEKIEKFRKSYLKLRLPVTPKLHAIFYHITDFCSITKRGLAPWSEQCSESIHHDFKTLWEHFKVKDVENPKYGENLLRAVCMYNSLHFD